VHQHLDIGQGEVDWDEFFATLTELEFDGIATVCVFAWEERARESSAHNLAQIRQYLAKHAGGSGPAATGGKASRVVPPGQQSGLAP
jgi:myo-inositol catabolism protein IolH